MRAGQRVAGFRVVKCLAVNRGRLPVPSRVASSAIGSETALMGVFMTTEAPRREAEPGPIQILALQKRSRLRGNVLRRVAGAATHARVLSVERVSGLGVIESLRRRSPVNHLEIGSVVIRMALDACCSRRAGPGIGRMKTLVRLNLVGNFLMALQTLERGGLGGNFMTLDAIRRPSKALVRPGKRTGGNLRICGSGETKPGA